jgi:ankyrin repeat protein
MGHKLDMEDPVGLQLFLDHGANPNQLGREKTAIQGRRPLHFAIMRHRSARHIRILVKAGADPNLADAQGETPLAMARRLGHAEAARALKAAGALNESTPRADLMAAIMSGNARAARRLIPNPVEFTGTLTEEERALLPFAAEAGNIKAVRVMLDLGWDIETEGSWKGTALHQAIYHGHLALVKFLLARGASVTHKNGSGGGAMGIAMHTALHEGREKFAPIVRLIASRAPRDRLPQHIEAARNEGNLKIVKLLETIAARESER